MRVIEENGVTRYIADENDEVNQISDEQYVELYKQEIEQKATDFVKRQLSKLDYDNEGEVALYAANENSQWHDEAVKLQSWIEEVYKKMYELQDSVTVDNYKDFNINSIKFPKFEG